MKILNFAGTICGYPLGVLVGAISFIRNSRMFHPEGMVIRGEVKNLWKEKVNFPEECFLRFSSAWWKYKEWRDVLGIAIRFGEKQDLLFASFKHAWQTPIGPMLTRYHDYFENHFYAVAPFTLNNDVVFFRLTPHEFKKYDGPREQRLIKNIKDHAKFRLYIKMKNQEWTPLAEITLLELIDMDQRTLRFNPFLCGLNIYPEGFIQHLRIGVYRLGQFSRLLRKPVKKVPHHFNDRFVVHRL